MTISIFKETTLVECSVCSIDAVLETFKINVVTQKLKQAEDSIHLLLILYISTVYFNFMAN